MRLHRLEVTAFGPFAGTQSVDFDALAAGGLFLLHGATGAGKTSVLDAVCYTLYGDLPGARQGTHGLRSHHAAEDAAPQVVLDATIRQRRLRITRSPAWQRPKRRGSGTTEEKAKTLVEELTDGGWVALSTDHREAGQLLAGLLGMGREQFCQVAMLPQGDFATFLRAGAAERAELLKRLFGTERFAQVEAWLVARRVALGREREAAEAAVRIVVERTAEAAGVETAPDDADPATWLTRLAGTTDSELRAARGTLDQHAAALVDARRSRDAARELVERQRRHAEACVRQRKLAEQDDEREGRQREVDGARRAVAALPLVRAADEAAVEQRRAEEAARAARRRVADLDATKATLEPTELRSAERAALGEGATLRELMAEETRLTALRAEIAQLDGHVRADTDRAEELDAELGTLPARRGELDEQLAASREAGAQLQAATKAVEQAAGCHDAACRRDVLSGRLTGEQTGLTDATRQALRDKEAWLSLRERRLAGIAAELAGQLTDGAGCPVCGSIEHPGPAEPSAEHVSADDEQRAQRAAERAERHRVAAEQHVVATQRDLAAVRAIAGDAPATDLATKLAETKAHARALSARADETSALATARDELTDQEKRLRTAREDVAASRERGESRRAGRTAEADRIGAVLDRARGDDPSVQARAQRLSAVAAALGDAAQAAEAASRAGKAAADAVLGAERAAREAGFAATDAVRDAFREPGRLTELEAASQADRDERAAVADLLSDPALVAASAETPADVEGTDAAARTAEGEHAAARGDVQRLTNRAAALARLDDELAARLGELQPVAEQHATVDALARLAEGKSGENALRMSLSSYVLAARLEQVAAAASERLRRMSSGRYELVHTDERIHGRGTSGLGLRVIDAWTGVERDTASLSGGESFSASLSLALGLADVVTAEAGGTPIDTLFVDEGFGSLDADTLDEVMTVLDDLRDGGKSVGIVSHIADLRDRIPMQLRVIKSRRGSRLLSMTSASSA